MDYFTTIVNICKVIDIDVVLMLQKMSELLGLVMMRRRSLSYPLVIDIFILRK